MTYLNNNPIKNPIDGEYCKVNTKEEKNAIVEYYNVDQR
jgi:hypothetical protein